MKFEQLNTIKGINENLAVLVDPATDSQGRGLWMAPQFLTK